MQNTGQTFNVEVARKNGLETGQEFVLIRDEWISMFVREDNKFDLVVNNEVVFTDTHGKVTNTAKRIANPDHTGNLNTFRSWKTPEGTRIGDFMPFGDRIGSEKDDNTLGGGNEEVVTTLFDRTGDFLFQVEYDNGDKFRVWSRDASGARRVADGEFSQKQIASMRLPKVTPLD